MNAKLKRAAERLRKREEKNLRDAQRDIERRNKADAELLAKAINAPAGIASIVKNPGTLFQVVPATPDLDRKPPPGSWRDYGTTMTQLRRLRGYNRDTAEGELSPEAKEHLAAEERRKKADK